MKRSSEWFSRARASSRLALGPAQLGIAPRARPGARQARRARHAARSARAHQLGQAAHRGGQHRHAGGHRLERRVGRELVVARGHEQHGARRPAAPPRARVTSAEQLHVGAAARDLGRQLSGRRPLAGDLAAARPRARRRRRPASGPFSAESREATSA